MKLIARVMVGVMLISAAILLFQPVVLAASRSVSVSVSCSVPASAQFSAPAASGQRLESPAVSTNTGSNYTVTQDIKTTSQGMVKQYSITVL